VQGVLTTFIIDYSRENLFCNLHSVSGFPKRRKV